VNLEKIIEQFRNGKPIAICDDPTREGEADIVVHASICTPDKIRLMRKDAGGMICLCTSIDIGKKLDLQFFADYMRAGQNQMMKKLAIAKTPYGDEPSFCTYINSRKVYTGITDEDRSKTVLEFAKLVEANKDDMKEMFVRDFYSPGHVPLLCSRTIEKRKGHTEMAVELCNMANMSSAVVICEILGDDDKALSFENVAKYCKNNDFAFVRASEFGD
jgi:3,4-dihydroxy 2-butanone 4-phosphate synthase